MPSIQEKSNSTSSSVETETEDDNSESSTVSDDSNDESDVMDTLAKLPEPNSAESSKKKSFKKKKVKNHKSSQNGNDYSDDDSKESQNRTNDNDDDDELSVKDSAKKNDNKTNPKPRKRKSVGTAAALNKTYIQICQEAIAALKDRTGSSLAAIKKWTLAQYPDLGGPHFKSRINQALKNGLKQKRFEKVKGSFKISSAFKEVERAKKRKQAAHVAKTKKAAEAKTLALKKKAHEAAKKKAEEERKRMMSAAEKERLAKEQAAREEAARRRAAAEARAKAIAERIRKRKYPMEDTKLHAEDKELGVKPPADICPRPSLPYFWHITRPLSDKSRTGRTSAVILTSSKVEGLDYGSRGLVPDLLHIYHFFRGDVHFTLSPESSSIVPDFTLQQLVYSTEQIINGNAKRSKLIPPLINHLFVTCLQILWQKPTGNSDDTVHVLSKNERKLREDCHKYLLPSLTPVSWADVCFLYFDAMERYYSSDTSRDPNVLQPLPIDAEYLLGLKDEMIIPDTPFAKKKVVSTDEMETGDGSHIQLRAELPTSHPLPDGYFGYLGDHRGVLYRAHHKLLRQDPWNLSAEELTALLRALTDDILATHPSAATDIAAREEQMQELLKAKRAADVKFRKVRLAFEGPKRPAKKPTPICKDDSKDSTINDKKMSYGRTSEEKTNGTHDDQEDNEEKNAFKPTATKKQFEAAKKAMEKANDAYEKGIRKLVARTEPVGYDRNYNAVYCFRHDPEILYVEDRKAASGSASSFPLEMQFPRFSWHAIETTSLFDMFTTALDIRGKREHDLYEELIGPSGSHQSLRRFLFDDIKELQVARAKLKEKEALMERLKAAMIKCDDEQGRRSGRLAGHAESELIALQAELEALEKEAAGKIVAPPRNHWELMGMEALKKFEAGNRMETRRSRDKKATSKTRDLPLIPSSKVCGTGNIDGTGLVGIIVSELLELEEFCETLVPWDQGKEARKAWIARLEEAVYAWNSISSDLFSLLEESEASAVDPNSLNACPSLKRESLDCNDSLMHQKMEQSTHSVATILSLLKVPVLELEDRIADVTNVDVATRDADLADENLSTNGSEDDAAEKERLDRAWKKLVHKIRETPTKSHLRIRDILVAAISAARKAHDPEVVAKLRAALLLYHPNAAGECKLASIKVLEEYGDYDEEDDEDSDEETEEKEENKEEPVPSVLCAEAVILSSCLGGADEATRSDWISAVKTAKTISRFSALTAAFIKDSTDKLTKLEVEQEALTSAIALWEKEEDRKQKKIHAGKKVNENAVDGPSEVWANVDVTDEICMAKAENFPWWPAKKCLPKDPEIASSLAKLNRCIVAFIGEMGGLRVVKIQDTAPFTGQRIEEDENLAEHKKEIKAQLDDCIAIARRILRGHAKRKRKK